MRTVIAIVITLLVLSLGLISCDRAMVYDDFQRIEDGSWAWDDPAEFNFSISDTSGFHDILIHLRHSTEYPMSNLYLFVHVTGPSGQELSDTLQMLLAENSGEWIGRGVGNLREIGYLYRKNTMFPEPGEYSISIEQAMRLPELPVSGVGVRISKANP
jgi:gliding motility-associated lipoprotein GldH